MVMLKQGVGRERGRTREKAERKTSSVEVMQDMEDERVKKSEREGANGKKNRKAKSVDFFCLFTFLSLFFFSPLNSLCLLNQTTLRNHDADQQEAQGMPLEGLPMRRREASSGASEAARGEGGGGVDREGRRRCRLTNFDRRPPALSVAAAFQAGAPSFSDLLPRCEDTVADASD